MKALLVIEMPNSCGECRFCDYNDSIKTSFCTADTSHMFSMQEEGGVYTIQRNKQCPLKPMPKKFNDDVYEDWMMFEESEE